MNPRVDLEHDLRQAVELRESDRFEESCVAFQELARRFPDNAEVNFQAAWSHDRAGREEEACGYYEQALKSPDLPAQSRREALLGLGSTYRVLGRHREAVSVLEGAVREFPDTAALRAFLAIADFAAGSQEKAFGMLLRLLADTSSDTSIIGYRRPIGEYAEEFLAD